MRLPACLWTQCLLNAGCQPSPLKAAGFDLLRVAGRPILCVSVVCKGWGLDSTQSRHKLEPFSTSPKP